ncbi:MAG: hypothetical protein ABSG41_10735 [Bryobacteraceae bacterium]|jgi:hypothetical protein
MTDERLADELVRRALGWRPAPDRYVKPGRSWIPRSKFRPLADVRDAFRLLDAVTADYALVTTPGGTFTAQVRLAGRTGQAAGEPKARTICLALAQALGLEAEANG